MITHKDLENVHKKVAAIHHEATMHPYYNREIVRVKVDQLYNMLNAIIFDPEAKK